MEKLIPVGSSDIVSRKDFFCNGLYGEHWIPDFIYVYICLRAGGTSKLHTAFLDNALNFKLCEKGCFTLAKEVYVIGCMHMSVCLLVCQF